VAAKTHPISSKKRKPITAFTKKPWNAVVVLVWADDLFFRNRLVGGADDGGTDGDMDHMGDDEYANDNDLGVGGDSDDGDGDDGCFVTFMAMDENGARFSLPPQQLLHLTQ
jgi:hypothetical protein